MGGYNPKPHDLPKDQVGGETLYLSRHGLCLEKTIGDTIDNKPNPATDRSYRSLRPVKIEV